MFPTLGQPTGALEIPTDVASDNVERFVMLPRRKQASEDDLRDRIKAERRQRRVDAEGGRQRQAWLAANDEPTPF